MQDRSSATETYDPAYFASLMAIEDKHFWFKARNRIIGDQVARIVAGFEPGYRVIEVGCGTGNVLRVLEQVCRDGHVVGMDLFSEGLEFARRRTKCPLVQGDIRNPPFGERFAVVGLFDVLEHLPDDLQILTDLRKVLVPGGALLLTVPAHASLWSYFDEAAHHQRRYERGNLATKLEQTGYRVEFLTEFMSCTFPLVWLGRRAAALKGKLNRSSQSDLQRAHELTSQELQITPVVNELLTWALMLEARFVARGYRLPIGSSLLAVARKVGE